MKKRGSVFEDADSGVDDGVLCSGWIESTPMLALASGGGCRWGISIGSLVARPLEMMAPSEEEEEELICTPVMVVIFWSAGSLLMAIEFRM